VPFTVINSMLIGLFPASAEELLVLGISVACVVLET
jgi:hypothetical protein